MAMESERDKENCEFGTVRAGLFVPSTVPVRLSCHYRHPFGVPCHRDQPASTPLERLQGNGANAKLPSNLVHDQLFKRRPAAYSVEGRGLKGRDAMIAQFVPWT